MIKQKDNVSLFLVILLLFLHSNTNAQKTPERTDDSGLSGIEEEIPQIETNWSTVLSHPWILVDSSDQRLYLVDLGKVSRSWPISTAKKGMGNEAGSEKTPLGAHRIFSKIGESVPSGSIFINRINTGRVAQIHTDAFSPDEDLITSRILWLTGLEAGINQGGEVDSKDRMIYIHGTDAEGKIGAPSSHGCIRMKNADIISLFRLVDTGCFVYIQW